MTPEGGQSSTPFPGVFDKVSIFGRVKKRKEM